MIPKLAIATLAAAGGMFGQVPAARPAFDSFEVATVKPPAPDVKGRYIRMESAHQFVARNHALHTLIAAAYNLSPRAILGGPAWFDSEHFDILAKTPGEVRPNLDEQMAMLRKLLADRFQLAFHHEPKEMAYYALMVAKGGPKMKESTLAPDGSPQGPPPLIFVLAPQLVRLPARYATIGEFASVLQRAALDHPVVDKTGLSGRYDFDLEFAPDESVFGGILKAPDDATKPSLFSAVQQQLGLKLVATRGLVDAMVIDRAERPTEN
jgi:uncharacterized protein (TIGR03435 family)